MYIQKTKFYCPKCRTHDHWGNERCPKDVPETDLSIGKSEGENGGEISESEGSHQGDATLLSGKAAEKDLKPGSSIDPRKAELPGKAIHQNVPKSRRAVSCKENPVQAAQEFIRKIGRPKKYPDRKTQMRELMRKRRAKS